MKHFFKNNVKPDPSSLSSADMLFDRTHKTHAEASFFTLYSNPGTTLGSSGSRTLLQAASRNTTTTSTTVPVNTVTQLKDQNATIDWKLCFQHHQEFVEFTLFMNSPSVLRVTNDFRNIGYVMITLVGIRLLSLAILIISHDRSDFSHTLLAMSISLLIIAILFILLMLGFFLWNRFSTNVSQMLIDEGVFLSSVLFVNVFALIAAQVQLEFTDMDELNNYSSAVNSYYASFNPEEAMTLAHEILLYVMLLPVIAHASCATVRWVYVFFAIPVVLAVAITVFVQLEGYQSFALIIALLILDIYLLASQRVDRIRLFNSSRKIQEVATTSKEVTIHLQSQEKEAVNLRHIVANTAHDLKTPVVAMVHGCEILHANISEINKACSSINQKVQPIDQEIKDHVLRRTAYVDEEMRAALDTLEDIKNTSNFMLLTINRFLDYTKVAHGFKLAPKLDTFNLQEALQLAIHCIGKAAILEKVEVAPIPPNICKYIVTDKQWFQENIICLVSNALKFSPNGGIKIRISMRIPPPKLIASPENSMRNLDKEKGHGAQSIRILNKMSEISVRWNGGKDKKAESSISVAIPREFDYEGYKVYVEVSDCGVGISKEMQRQLFEPFRQAQRLAGGTGLGLFSLSKRLDALQGEYGVKDREDGKQGSVFWFAFPYRPDEMCAHTMDNASEKGAASSKTSVKEFLSRRSEKIQKAIVEKIEGAIDETAESTPECSQDNSKKNIVIPPPIVTTIVESTTSAEYLPGKISPAFSPRAAKQKPKQILRVLIIDDSQTILKMTSKLLLRFGYEVHTAENGYDAIQLLEREGFMFDVVLTDLEMPVMDGLEMMKRIRQMEENRFNADPSNLLDKNKIYNALIDSKDDDDSAKPKFPRTFNTKPLFLIASSANTSPGTVEESLSAGANEFLGKPITSSSFQNILKTNNLLKSTR